MKFLKNIFLVLISVLLYTNLLSAQMQSNVVSASLLKNTVKAEAGSEVTVELNTTVEKGWHVNSNKPNEDFLIACKIASKDAKFPLANVVYPKPEQLKMEISEKPVSVFEGTTKFKITIKIDKSTPGGEYTVPIEFSYQACNDQTCLPPNSVTANLTVQVTNANGAQKELTGQTETKIDTSLTQSTASGTPANPTGTPGSANTTEKEQAQVVDNGSGITSLLVAILFAFAGGIILNLMPCVLPVLSLKIFGFVKQAGEDKKKVLHHGLMFTFGVLASFWLLAGILLILRAGGEKLGWGFQLQSPVFIVILSVFFFLFALSMFGVFEIGTSLTRIQGSSSGLMGSFMSGVTATVIATPCTAPFMGSALGFALTQPAYYSLLVFSFIGLGMAFPYLILSANTKLLKFIPKPGAWMETFKQFMGFLLVGTVVWLIWVLSFQVESEKVVVLLITLTFAGIASWVWGKWGTIMHSKRTRLIALLVAAVLIIAPTYKTIESIKEKPAQSKVEWLDYSPELVSELRKEGKPVFIDFTAKWCLSCQVNKKVALHTQEVEEAFAKHGVTLVTADWTNQDSVIADALAKFNRNSVPLYVLYSGDQNKPPVILPEILTPDIVIEAVDKL